MVEIDNIIVSSDVFNEQFVCDLTKCKGQCCVDGDAGAPLTEEETQILESIYPIVKEYLSEDGKNAIETKGTFVQDFDGDWVTPLVEKRECAYVYFDDDIAKCAIEKAYLEGKVTFRKPISCHLYPIRLTEYSNFHAANYHKWHICHVAVQLGRELKVPVYSFLKEPLTRKYGSEWYEKLTIAANELKSYGRI
jgi:hypothetical protein